MAKLSIQTIENLDDGFILTPERYEVKKMQKAQLGTPLSTLCTIVKESLTQKRANSSTNYLILDTGDAKEGFIRFKKVVKADKIGSTKKIIQPGDIIISRLRPYLRQVGYLDKNLFDYLPPDTTVICSTEFFVLRSDSDISYLAPFLLTEQVQSVIASAQEGGHHPRFTQEILENLKIEQKIVSVKDSISIEFKNAIDSSREGEQRVIKQLISLDT